MENLFAYGSRKKKYKKLFWTNTKGVPEKLGYEVKG
jgi:hypothetical protein